VEDHQEVGMEAAAAVEVMEVALDVD